MTNVEVLITAFGSLEAIKRKAMNSNAMFDINNKDDEEFNHIKHVLDDKINDKKTILGDVMFLSFDSFVTKIKKSAPSPSLDRECTKCGQPNRKKRRSLLFGVEAVRCSKVIKSGRVQKLSHTALSFREIFHYYNFFQKKCQANCEKKRDFHISLWFVFYSFIFFVHINKFSPGKFITLFSSLSAKKMI